MRDLPCMPARAIRRAAVLALLSLCLFVFLPLAISLGAQARTILDLDVRVQPVQLGDWGDYWVDPTGRATPEEAAYSPALTWTETRTNQVYRVQKNQAVWIRFTVPPAPDRERWYLGVAYPSLNRASLYTLDSADQWIGQSAGDTIPADMWPVPNRYPLLPIALSAEVPTKYLLRLENNQSFSAPLTFISDSRLNSSGQRASLVLGLFFGITAIIFIYAALSAVALRDNAYGWFSMYVVLLSLTQACLTGLAGLHLWPNAASFTDLSTWLFSALTAGATMLFISTVTAMPERSKVVHRLLMAGAVVGLASAAAVFVVPESLRYFLLVPAWLVLQTGGMLAICWAWRLGDRLAPWLLLSFVPIFAGAGFVLAQVAGLFPVGFMSLHGPQLAVALHLPLVAALLTLRSRHRRENTRRIQGLERVDPATGLINEQVFAERLTRMIARSARLRHQGAVLLIELMNVEQIQRDFGRQAAEEVPLRVAERLLSITREIDSAARLPERRFGMLIEGPFSLQSAAAMGPRIVARCLMPYPGLHVECVAQVRIAYALAPHPGTNADTLVAQLGARLAAEPLRSKRAIFTLTETAPATSQPVHANKQSKAEARRRQQDAETMPGTL